jgi:hypothetical protein
MAAVIQYPALRPYDLRKIGSTVAKVSPELQLCCKNIAMQLLRGRVLCNQLLIWRARACMCVWGRGMALLAHCSLEITWFSFCVTCERGLVFLLKPFSFFLLFLLVSHLYIHIAPTSGFRLNQKSVWAASTCSGTMRIVLPLGWILFGKEQIVHWEEAQIKQAFYTLWM